MEWVIRGLGLFAQQEEKETPSLPDSPVSPPVPQPNPDFNVDFLYGEHAHPDLSDWSAHTLQSLLSQALPLCDIRPPHVIIMGAQSSGKTLLIISMVFYYLKNVRGIVQLSCTLATTHTIHHTPYTIYHTHRLNR
ncbi:hypothetical protein EON63_10530 [archaeon]|nr:MAG: hypothetical protein EON63_10530 [archaeon]